MSDSTITLKTVDDLRLDSSGNPQRYWIAAYQRGYRWSPLQVRQLLDDIREFKGRRKPEPEDFYCLQPLVLKKLTDGRYEVVDGQQRLTTLLLILRHLNERQMPRYRQMLFTLDYKTRPELLSFLDNPTPEMAKKNADFFHLHQAINVIEEWFDDKETEVEGIKSALLNQTKVIWFQLSNSDNAVEAFTRLNVGKIPLTTDELIRALFLKRSDEKQYQAAALQLKIAHEWDQLEKSLQSDPFWYFLSNQPTQGQNRIGFLFELVTKAEGVSNGYDHDVNGVFYAYSKKLNQGSAKTETEWLKIKQAFMTLEEWFEDRNLYHMVGFLIHQGVQVDELLKLSEQCSKKVFACKLRDKIWFRTFGPGSLATLSSDQLREKITKTLDDLEYGKDSTKIRSLLLLFNLATLLESPRSNIRFQFDSFKRENWDIEHVRSVASDRPERYDERKKWLEHCLGYFNKNKRNETAELRAQIEVFVALAMKEADEEVFEQLYDKLLNYFQEAGEEETDDGIANLTLLDYRTNRSYKNAVFAVKRQRLLDLDQSGIFVPLCTRNVFLKCYSPQADNVMFWSKEDREAYRSVIVTTFLNFFHGESRQGETI